MVTGLAASWLVSDAAGLSGAHRVLFVSAGVLGSIAPDVDTRGSVANRLLSFGVDLIPGHRTGWTHSAVSTLGFGVLATAVLWWLLSWTACVAGLGVAVGCVVHLAGDTLTMSGVPWFWPWSAREPALKWFRSGDWRETPVAFAFALVCAVLSVICP